MFDPAEFGKQMAKDMKSLIIPLQNELTLLRSKISELENAKAIPGPMGEQGPRGEKGERGEEGVGIASQFIDHAGQLVCTFTDGTVGTPGIVKGEDGHDGHDGVNGKDGRDGEPGVNGKDGRDGINGKDGRDGKDGADGENGKDGLGFDEFEEIMSEDGKSVIHRYSSGKKVQQYLHPLPAFGYRGVFKEGEKYGLGDFVTYGGSIWHANIKTSTKPGSGSPDWVLSCKHGRDGKDGEKGEKGDKGDPGKDFTPIVEGLRY